MNTIDSPRILVTELRRILSYLEEPRPSRVKLATELRSLAARVVLQDPPQEQGTRKYRDLGDAAQVTGNPLYGKSGASIWYAKPGDDQRDLSMGYDWIVKRRPDLILDIPKETHEFVGTIGTRKLNEIYQLMQGEFWSPNGEAKAMIQRLGLHHTSMSVGDVIQIGSDYFFVDRIGFEKMAARIEEV